MMMMCPVTLCFLKVQHLENLTADMQDILALLFQQWIYEDTKTKIPKSIF